MTQRCREKGGDAKGERMTQRGRRREGREGVGRREETRRGRG